MSKGVGSVETCCSFFLLFQERWILHPADQRKPLEIARLLALYSIFDNPLSNRSLSALSWRPKEGQQFSRTSGYIGFGCFWCWSSFEPGMSHLRIPQSLNVQ